MDEPQVRALFGLLSDADARPAGAAHPLANLWDNGDDPVASLRHEMDVRAIGLAQRDGAVETGHRIVGELQ